MALADDPDRLVQFAQRLQDVGKARGDDSIQQRKSLLGLMHGLANYTADRKPAELDSVLDRMAGAAAQLPPDMLLTLITDPPPMPSGSGAARMDLAGELQARLTDEMLTKFLVDNIVKDRGATNRLATAFQTLVPDPAKQQDILAAAGEQAAEIFKNDPQFESVWTSSSEMLMSYSDEKFVSEGYARELTTAQTPGGRRRDHRRRPAGADSGVGRDRRRRGNPRARSTAAARPAEDRNARRCVVRRARYRDQQHRQPGAGRRPDAGGAAARGGRGDCPGRVRRRLRRRPRPASPSWSRARWSGTSRCSCSARPTRNSASPRRCAPTSARCWSSRCPTR